MIAVSLVLPTYLPSLLSRALLLLLLLFSNAITIFSSAASFAALDILPTRVISALLLLLLVFLLLRRILLSRLVQVLALKNSRRRLRESRYHHHLHCVSFQVQPRRLRATLCFLLFQVNFCCVFFCLLRSLSIFVEMLLLLPPLQGFCRRRVLWLCCMLACVA